VKKNQLNRLRTVITESLRVQQETEKIDYINVGSVLNDARAKQNHAIFARRGCGKTLLLRESGRDIGKGIAIIYLNCEDFKQHSFPNVLIEIMSQVFKKLDQNLWGWFGKSNKSKKIIAEILAKLDALQKAADQQVESVRQTNDRETSGSVDVSVGSDIPLAPGKLQAAAGMKSKSETERTYQIYSDKIQKLDLWLPELKAQIREIFSISGKIKTVFIQIDDLYHLRRADQAFIVDYIHRLCKDLPIYFKIATLRHASTLYVDRSGQPIGAQERHDYQPINIDFSFSNFNATKNQNYEILKVFAKKAGVSDDELDNIFKGQGFSRLVMAGGGLSHPLIFHTNEKV
jgi:Cdc6-like AAA superfamily ATPase